VDNDVLIARRRAILAAIDVLRDVCGDGCALGLGTGSTIELFIDTVKDRDELSILRKSIVFPSSRSTASKLFALGIAPTMYDTYADVITIDVYIDSADEVDHRCYMVKGGGGALLREKVLTMLARTTLFIVDFNKLSDLIGTKKPVPIEVVPSALPLVMKSLKDLRLEYRVRLSRTSYGVTYSDNGNALIDIVTGPITDPESLDSTLAKIPGVVATGIFSRKYVSKIFIGFSDHVKILTP